MTSQLEQISNLFGSYKAEWLSDSLFELFTEPSYYPELTTSRPCALIGGRGTGKTTVLKTLSHQGQFEILRRKNHEDDNIDQWEKFLSQPYFGFYYRVSTPRVTAFKGAGVSEEVWAKLFRHYITLEFSLKAFSFMKLIIDNSNLGSIFHERAFEKVTKVLALPNCNNFTSLINAIEDALYDIEIYVNNIGIESCPKLSTAGAIDSVFSEITRHQPFQGKTFFLIIDEYENFLNFQQVIVNTLIKHATSSYTFKIGARHLGWRSKATENTDEFLHHPSDYVLINIAEAMSDEKFAEFAERVCNARLSAVFGDDDIRAVKDLLPSLSTDREAQLLGLEPLANELKRQVKASEERILISKAEELSDLDLYVIDLWALGEGRGFLDVFKELITEPEKWSIRIREYRYSALFNIRKGKSGIKKYYAGWPVYLKLCGDNIRYLMELVEKAIRVHSENDEALDKPISYTCQTEAAISVGKKNLDELSGLSIFGAKLTKLTLALGRIFGLLASDSAGHSIEVNQFRISAKNSDKYSSVDDWLLKADSKTSQLLRASVMHLALQTFPGNKPKGEGDLKDDTYQLHPIFAPFFNYSHRRRRNLFLYEDEIIELVDSAPSAIKKIVQRQNRAYSEELPDQLKLFEDFLNA